MFRDLLSGLGSFRVIIVIKLKSYIILHAGVAFSSFFQRKLFFLFLQDEEIKILVRPLLII